MNGVHGPDDGVPFAAELRDPHGVASTTEELMSKIALLSLVLVACGSGKSETPPASSPEAARPTIEGHWVSDGCESMPDGKGGKTYFNREFTIDAQRWSIVFSIFGDAACSTKLLQADIGGPYTIKASSTRVAGAWEADFAIDKRMVTPLVPPLAEALDSMKCGTSPWKAGAGQDLLANGCPSLGMHPIAACAKEHDVIRRDGDRLSFGARPADGNMCTEDKRPTALGAALVKR
jgi:hypothetical protein